MAPSAAALLLLSDGRFPAGGYAHSGGLEPTIAAGRVRDITSLGSFLEGRAATVGAMTAAFAAASFGVCTDDDTAGLAALDAELDARMPSPAQRATSRQLGRQLLRVISVIRPRPSLEHLSAAPHQPLVLGAAGAALGLTRGDVALAALHESVAGPAAAAVRLLSLDPFATHAVLARLGPLLDDLAGVAVAASYAAPEQLPAPGTPLLDIAAERHTTREMRLFAS